MMDLSKIENELNSGIDSYIRRIHAQKGIYAKIFSDLKENKKPVTSLNDKDYFLEIIQHFGPALDVQKAQGDLSQIFDAAFHQKTGSLIVANKGATLLCTSPRTSAPYITRQIGCMVYRPGLGVEVVNVGLVGNVYEGEVILRTESACAPSFIFGSNRCNCAYQWASIRELAAHLNPVDLPKIDDGEEFEKWVQEQFHCVGEKHIAFKNGPGMVLMHIDSQGGMGSGYTKDEFVYDLLSRALLRQLGENSSEQIFKTSIKEGYASIGVTPDSRLENNEAGYQITYILLDWLGVSRNLICLSNNTHKLNQLSGNGYHVKRVKSIGKVDKAGAREAEQRRNDFKHLDIDGSDISFEEEMNRLKEECNVLDRSI